MSKYLFFIASLLEVAVARQRLLTAYLSGLILKLSLFHTLHLCPIEWLAVQQKHAVIDPVVSYMCPSFGIKAYISTAACRYCLLITETS